MKHHRKYHLNLCMRKPTITVFAYAKLPYDQQLCLHDKISKTLHLKNLKFHTSCKCFVCAASSVSDTVGKSKDSLWLICIFIVLAFDVTIWIMIHILSLMPKLCPSLMFSRPVKSHGWIQRGGQGVRTPMELPLLIFAMLKFSVRPLLGIGTPPENIFWIRA